MRPILVASLAFVMLPSLPRIADACGACVHEPPPPMAPPSSVQVVTDHRMVVSIGPTQTTLWDQIRYAGDASEFLWVLPIGDAAHVQIGVADNAFVNAIDDLTAPVVTAPLLGACVRDPNAPTPSGGGYSPGYGSGGGGGCGFGGSFYSASSDSGSYYSDVAARDATRSADTGVDVGGAVAAADVGPYRAELVRAQPDALGHITTLTEFLAGRGITVDQNLRPAVQYYTDRHSDFLVLTLRPSYGVQQMQPVRVTFPGYNPALPLRMVAGGAADDLGLLVMVIANAPMAPEGWTNRIIPRDHLVYDFATSRSNYSSLFTSTVSASGGSAWITESIVGTRADTMAYVPVSTMPPMMGSDQLQVTPSPPYADRAIAFQGLSGDLFVTRLRTRLPVSALGRDLMFTPSTFTAFGPEIGAPIAQNAPPCPFGTVRSRGNGPRAQMRPWFLLAIGFAFAARRARKSRH